jgi:hypothetical protein
VAEDDLVGHPGRALTVDEVQVSVAVAAAGYRGPDLIVSQRALGQGL